MNESKSLSIQLSSEDCDRLEAEAKRCQIDPSNLAQTLLRNSLDKVNPPLVPLLQADIESLGKFYNFRERPEVLQFLNRYPLLVPILLEIPDKIHHYFPDSQLFLQVVIDPEIIDYVKLLLSISSNFELDESLDRLDRLDENWWLHTPYEARRWLCIDLDFQ